MPFKNKITSRGHHMEYTTTNTTDGDNELDSLECHDKKRRRSQGICGDTETSMNTAGDEDEMECLLHTRQGKRLNVQYNEAVNVGLESTELDNQTTVTMS